MQSSPLLLSSLLARFRASYPTGSLISEFLTVNDGNYAIRALAQVGGITLASGMAAHPNLEIAEDQAKARALEALGLTPPPVEPPSYPLPSWDSYNVPVEPAPVAPPKSPTLDRPTPPGLDQLQSIPEPIATESPPEKMLELVPQRVESPETNKTIKPKKDNPEESSLAEETQDRSDEIARIGVEMKRLGWTTIQGRDYLKQRYGKRSRQELNDSELLDFLAYLESQPAPSSK
ncbi:MAG: hypothetical protein KME11_02380 [Timaviella obliquedivisa GSE-PSE-MK23-08B]|nr:hypothetical protein [Timaviella obliquedivisa GSE-PSE-MK23-08B]